MNPTEQFREAIRADGLQPPDVIEPGKFHKFPGEGKGNGNTAAWCKLFADGIGGVYGAQRTVFSSIYSGHMASGEAVTSDKDITAWTMPQSGTIEGDLWKIACDRQ